MITTLSSPRQWAQHEFEFVHLGDKRLNQRLVQVIGNLAANPGGTLPQAFPDWDELKAAYRLLDNQKVTFEKVLTPHWERTRASCREPGEYLLIEDTSILDYSHHPATEDLGVIGNGKGRGFDLHSTLAVRMEQWTLDQRPEGTLLGLFHQQCLKPQPAPDNETRAERWERERKSQRWAAVFNQVPPPPADVRWIFVADREADFYEPMQTCQSRQLDFIIRCYQDRRLADEEGTHLREALKKAASRGESIVEVRARPGQAARVATCEIRAITVDLDGPWRPGGWQPPLKGVTVVEVQEINAPAGVEPLHWMLLTSLACTTWAEIQRVVGRYTARWWIEEYHKALKTGTGVEESQLEKGTRLQPLIAVLAAVAVRLLSTKMLARSQPDGVNACESFGPEMLAILEAKFGPPKGGWNNASVLIAIARMGGFLARKNDGMPGWQTIWRGWHRLMRIAEGFEYLEEVLKRCG